MTASLTTAGLVLDWPVPVVVMLAALTAVVATPSYPALAAATPQTVSDVDLPAANSLATGVENAAWVAGPGLLGLVLLTGAPVAGGGLAATACFAVALVCLGRTHTPPPGRPTAIAGSLREDAHEGLRAITSDRLISATLALAIIDNFLFGYMTVALVLLGDRTFHAGQEGIGWLNAAFAAGAFASLVVTPRLASAGREPRVLALGMTLFVAAVAGTAIAPGLRIAVPMVVLAGTLTLIVEIVAVTRIQRLAPEAVTARVFGIYDTLAVGVIALGSVLAGVLSEAIGVSTGLLVACLATLALTGGCVPALRSSSRPAVAGATAPAATPGEA